MDVKRFTPKAIGCKNIPLGKQGETNAVRLEFLCAEWLNEYPAARIELHVTIPDGTAYTAKLEESGSTRAWNVTEPYTAQAGSGTIELILRDAATSTVIKSVTGRTHVEKSPSGDGQPAPPPDENGLNGYVRYDRAQALTAEERKRARENIGADGAGGVGGYYKPSVDAEGNLTWEKSAEAMPDAEGANIRGPEGKEGKTGPIGPQGPQGTAGHTPYIGENGNWWIAGGDTNTPATPQGGTGTVTGIQLDGETYEPDESGVVSLPDLGCVQTVCGIEPDDEGNVALDASHVGALPANGKAADSNKLNGNSAAHYATAEQINNLDQAKAPSGYGLGEIGKHIDDCNSATISGFYRFDEPLNRPFSWGVLIVCGRNDNSCSQIAIAHDGEDKGSVAVRQIISGSAGKWEYINPPAQINMEYPTTERFNRMPVYTKIIDCGLATNAKKIQTNINNAIRYAGRFGGLPIPFTSSSGEYEADVEVNEGFIVMKIKGFSNTQAYVQLWYIK